MATLRLFDPAPAHADASHHVTAPGGYEAWQFHAYDPDKRVRSIIAFHDGFALHPDYLRHFDAYRRQPTRYTPPTPCQYPCLTVAVYENQKPLANSTIQFPAGSFQAANSSVGLGPNLARFDDDKVSIELSHVGGPISATLCFRSNVTIPTIDKILPTSDAIPIEHHWLYARPFCQVSGEICIGPRTISITGIGQHNHHFAPGPFSGARRINGTILFPSSAVNFQAVDNRALVLSADNSVSHEIHDAAMSANSNRRTLCLLPYPSSIEFGEWLILRNPRVATTSPTHAELLFDAYVHGEQSTAWVEIAYPKHLRGFLHGWRERQRIVAAPGLPDPRSYKSETRNPNNE